MLQLLFGRLNIPLDSLRLIEESSSSQEELQTSYSYVDECGNPSIRNVAFLYIFTPFKFGSINQRVHESCWHLRVRQRKGARRCQRNSKPHYQWPFICICKRIANTIFMAVMILAEKIKTVDNCWNWT